MKSRKISSVQRNVFPRMFFPYPIIAPSSTLYLPVPPDLRQPFRVLPSKSEIYPSLRRVAVSAPKAGSADGMAFSGMLDPRQGAKANKMKRYLIVSMLGHGNSADEEKAVRKHSAGSGGVPRWPPPDARRRG